jgi:hypothetical protein
MVGLGRGILSTSTSAVVKGQLLLRSSRALISLSVSCVCFLFIRLTMDVNVLGPPSHKAASACLPSRRPQDVATDLHARPQACLYCSFSLAQLFSKSIFLIKTVKLDVSFSPFFSEYLD